MSAATLPSPLPNAALRLGMITAAEPGTSLVVALPGGDTALAGEQISRALVLLLTDAQPWHPQHQCSPGRHRARSATPDPKHCSEPRWRSDATKSARTIRRR